MIVEKQDGALPIRLWATDADEKTLPKVWICDRCQEGIALPETFAKVEAEVWQRRAVEGHVCAWCSTTSS